MKSPLNRLSLLSIMICVAGFACSGEPSDETTAAEAGDGDGDTSGGESGSASGSGDGDGDGDGDAETDPDCPPGTFDCPCDDGTCVEGLTCGGDGLCSLGGDPTTTTGDPTTTTGDPTTETTTTTGGGSAEPYDPAACEAPSEILHVEMLDGEFCATPCIADDECPEGPPGTTQACSISTDGEAPNFCGLICDPNDSACPEGSSCKEIPQQPGFGLCTYP